MQGEPRLDPHGAEGQAASDSRCPGRPLGVEHRLELLALAAWRGRYVLLVRDVLERIGYRVSEDERKALKGAYLDGGDDES